MSQQDIDTLRRLLEAFNGRDMERILSLTDPEFEAVIPAQLSAEPDTYRGHEGIQRYFESFYDVMDEISFQPHEFREVGDWVVIPFQMTARGRATDLDEALAAVAVAR